MRPRFCLSLALTVCLAAPLAAETGPCGLFEAVEPGDTLAIIAARCDTSITALQDTNPGIDASSLRIGSVLRVGGPEPRGAAPTGPMARYLSEFAGNYSPSRTCIGQELQVTLARDRVFIGETGCDLSNLSAIDERLFLDLTNCNAEGEPAPDRTYEISALPGGAIEIGGRQFLAQLQRCTDQ